VTQKLGKKNKLQLRRDRLAFYRHKTVVFSEVMKSDSSLDRGAPAAYSARSLICHVHSLSCYESPVHPASPQRSSLPFLHPYFVLLARRVSQPVLLSLSMTSSPFGGLP
jgi:hypothetical protein